MIFNTERKILTWPFFSVHYNEDKSFIPFVPLD